jgi:hypothetical protein
MTSTKQFLLGSALLLGGVRLTFVLIRAMTPVIMPVDPEAISQREARAPLAERLAIIHRHVKRTCELATR